MQEKEIIVLAALVLLYSYFTQFTVQITSQYTGWPILDNPSILLRQVLAIYAPLPIMWGNYGSGVVARENISSIVREVPVFPSLVCY